MEIKAISLFAKEPLPPELQEQLQLVASRLSVHVVSAPSSDDFSLEFADGALSLIDAGLGVLKMDFLGDHLNYKRKSHRGKSELIAKALGAAKGIKKVLDATAGLAQDAFFLSQLGFEVTATERSPVLYLLLKDGERRLGAEARIKFVFSDAARFITSGDFDSEAIYMDPMFPEKKKSALPRKEMQIFRKLVGNDEDALELLKTGLASSAQRVVVKRPLKAEPLLANPVHSFEGTTVRYDLYTAQGGK